MNSKLEQAQRQIVKWGDRYSNLSGTRRMIVGGGFGAVVAGTSTILDDKDDGVVGFVKNVAMGTAIDIATDHFSEQVMGMDRGKMITNMAKGQFSNFTLQRPHFTRNNRIGAAIGGAIGLVTGDGSAFGRLWDAGVGAIAGYGVSAVVDQMTKDKNARFQNTTETSVDIARNKDNNNQVKIKDVNAKEVSAAAQETLDERHLKMQKWAGNMKIAGKIAIAGIALGTVLDVSSNLHHKSETAKMVADQERQLAEKQREERKALNKMFGYETAVDFGNIVRDLWDERIGHHKMGNAKFQ